MNKLIISAIIVIASSNVHAEGFAPWPNPSRVGDAATTASVVTSPQSFYSAGLPRKIDRVDAVQQAVAIGPYYLASR